MVDTWNGGRPEIPARSPEWLAAVVCMESPMCVDTLKRDTGVDEKKKNHTKICDTRQTRYLDVQLH